MNRKVKVMQFGCGKMAKYLMRYALEKGAEITGAFDMNPNIIGKDISVVVGGENRGVFISPAGEFEHKIKLEKPDCVILATRSLLKDVAEVLKLCAKNGVNVVTTCDEALFPWNSSPNLTREIDLLAKENNCTITGAGFPDLSYCHLVAATAGSAHQIKKITGSASYNVEEYGIALAEHHGAGFTPTEFEEKIASVDRLSDEERNALIEKGMFQPIPMWNANGWICAKLGLTVKRQIQICEPIYAEKELFSTTLNRIIPVGDALGMKAMAKTETEEGITIETESIGKSYYPGEVDTNNWTIYGEADIFVSNEQIKNAEMICALMVSRVVDAINGPAGFVTSNHFEPAKYYVKPLNAYIK